MYDHDRGHQCHEEEDVSLLRRTMGPTQADASVALPALFAEIAMTQCWHCGQTWIARVLKPRRCPNCGRKL